MSKYGIFIIESLPDGNYKDGQALEKILDLADIKVEYRQANSKMDFVGYVGEFKNSGLRYLHISCHAAKDGFAIGNDDVSNAELEKIFGNSLEKKRVFLSACEAGNDDLAVRLITKNKAYSVIGTPIELLFEKAAIFWPSLFYAVHLRDGEKMTKEILTKTLEQIVNLLDVPINYYSFVRDKVDIVRRRKVRKDKETTRKTIKI